LGIWDTAENYYKVKTSNRQIKRRANRAQEGSRARLIGTQLVSTVDAVGDVASAAGGAVLGTAYDAAKSATATGASYLADATGDAMEGVSDVLDDAALSVGTHLGLGAETEALADQFDVGAKNARDDAAELREIAADSRPDPIARGREAVAEIEEVMRRESQEYDDRVLRQAQHSEAIDLARDEALTQAMNDEYGVAEADAYDAKLRALRKGYDMSPSRDETIGALATGLGAGVGKVAAGSKGAVAGAAASPTGKKVIKQATGAALDYFDADSRRKGRKKRKARRRARKS
jgi:hypothetical protein